MIARISNTLEESFSGLFSHPKELGSCFLLAILGLGLESCAGQFRQLVTFSYAQAPSSAVVLLGHGLCLAIAVSVLMLMHKRRATFLFNSRLWPVLICMGFSFGLFCYFSNYLLTISIEWLPTAGYLVATCVGSFYLFVWYERMFSFGLKNTLVIVGMSLVVRAGLQLLLLLLQNVPSIFLVSTMPLLSLPCFLAVFSKTRGATPGYPLYSDQDSSIHSSQRIEHSSAAIVSLFTVMALLLLLRFIVNGQVNWAETTPESPSHNHLLIAAVNVIAGGTAIFFSRQQIGKSLLFTFVLTTVALSCFSTFVSSIATEGIHPIYILASQLSVRLQDFTIIFMVFAFSKNGEARYGLYVASKIIRGVVPFLVPLLMTLAQNEFSDLNAIASSVVLASLFIALGVFFACLTTPPPVSKTDVNEPDPPIRKPFKDAIYTLALRGHLTPTEQTVLEFIARGQNADSVRQELQVSINTTKTHFRNIYAKLGVHSQQEIIAMVDDTIAKNKRPFAVFSG
ncbi:helix-turn-helix transcriptional regulator [Adlercreutzia sp. ZJ138]|uniref:helix-turn-helix domain-containing protein n=1 Tax=Adlercreutzia sp. ZJ138 TaxID=2709405 RepID=UPI0013EBF2FF|nr:helix-turn-helix transcriptional regulator [Adlercreutzia sp. ZJ138]